MFSNRMTSLGRSVTKQKTTVRINGNFTSNHTTTGLRQTIIDVSYSFIRQTKTGYFTVYCFRQTTISSYVKLNKTTLINNNNRILSKVQV